MHYRVVMQVDFGYMSTELYWYEGHMSNLDAGTASTHTHNLIQQVLTCVTVNTMYVSVHAYVCTLIPLCMQF